MESLILLGIKGEFSQKKGFLNLLSNLKT